VVERAEVRAVLPHQERESLLPRILADQDFGAALMGAQGAGWVVCECSVHVHRSDWQEACLSVPDARRGVHRHRWAETPSLLGAHLRLVDWDASRYMAPLSHTIDTSHGVRFE
jgi:hypothetical protein